ncbi:MAG: OstA-like protein [Bacteroidetes bacterium]|nr:OstA-like protein [Bacteroidota bacterium]MDA0938579.1 OstA-like protein [Bacteroidota bacterium]MDA1344970.1 OstA-like protein [Bacteroidota bacterium]
MKILKPLMFLFISIGPYLLWSQDSKIVEIRQAGSSTQDEVNFPGANILLRDKTRRVKLFHEGALVESDQSFFYAKRNFFTAQGTVVFTQGDSIRMTCKYMEYDGQTKKAKAWGQVVLSRPDMKLRTDTLYLDRIENRAFYNTPGTIIDEESTLTSRRGIYFMNEKKYRFINDVKIKNPDYKVDATQLDYFTESDLAYFYGPSTIVGKDYTIKSERGFYDTKVQRGNFEKNATIYYDGKIIKADSLFFENEREYASGTNRVSILDTLNQSLIEGHYGEIFKAKDSAIITRRAIATNIIENDSLFIHADTLIATGPDTARILRGFYDVRILKSDIRGRSDSLHFNETTGRIKLLKKPLTKKEEQIFTEKDKNLRNPILWFGASQMTGDQIYLISDLKTKALDSLKIIGDAFVIEKDTIGKKGYNQIKGGILDGIFTDGALSKINVVKNTQVVYYLYSDEDQALIGINKTICSALEMDMLDNEIADIRFFVSPAGNVFPEDQINENDQTLKGFIWRDNERPRTKKDLFSPEDLKLQLPKIRGIATPENFNLDTDDAPK